MSHARSPICVALWFAVAISAGCQSGVERDLVEREMRQQEDQIYALEDYLSEYQQLLCDARSENAMLKRQLVQGQFRDEQSSEKPNRSVISPSPPLGTSEPGGEPTAAPPPVVPPLNLREPAVPPLEDQSANEPADLEHTIQPATAEIEAVGKAVTAVVLRGEVRLETNDPQSGPRVLAEVEPVDGSGRPTQFRGRLSLLVLDPAARAKHQQLARWDFSAEELPPFSHGAKHGNSFEFPLQLPADVPTNRPLELWVRLQPEDGEKVLGRTTMDVSRTGRFASADVNPSEKRRRSVPVAAAEVPLPPTCRQAIRRIDTEVHQSDWQTARPGEVARPQAAVSKAAAEWKVATRPVPDVESTPVVQELTPVVQEEDRYGVAAAPKWSPERPENDQAESPQTPAWSPKR